jgi:hypothetical protein
MAIVVITKYEGVAGRISLLRQSGATSIAAATRDPARRSALPLARLGIT